MFALVKKNKRLYIVSEGGVNIYTPPDFLRDKIISRQQLQEVVGRLNAGQNYADVIMEFESYIADGYRNAKYR
jgi:hypothetical protein